MGLLNDLPQEEKPREKAKRYGIPALSNRDLLALLLRCGIKGHSVLEIADALLMQANGLKGLVLMNLNELREVSGISDVKALELQAVMELAKRISREEVRNRNVLSCHQDLERWLKREIGNRQQEEVLCVFLDSRGGILAQEILYRGTINYSTLSPYEVISHAMKHNCNRIVIAHNHPSGSLLPSDADIRVTEKLYLACKLMDITLVDHFIVTQDGCWSFEKAGYLQIGKQPV